MEITIAIARIMLRIFLCIVHFSFLIDFLGVCEWEFATPGKGFLRLVFAVQSIMYSAGLHRPNHENNKNARKNSFFLTEYNILSKKYQHPRIKKRVLLKSPFVLINQASKMDTIFL